MAVEAWYTQRAMTTRRFLTLLLAGAMLAPTPAADASPPDQTLDRRPVRQRRLRRCRPLSHRQRRFSRPSAAARSRRRRLRRCRSAVDRRGRARDTTAFVDSHPRPNRHAPRRRSFHRRSAVTSTCSVTAAVHNEEAVVSSSAPGHAAEMAKKLPTVYISRSYPERDLEARGPAAPCFHDITRLVYDLPPRRGACGRKQALRPGSDDDRPH